MDRSPGIHLEQYKTQAKDLLKQLSHEPSMAAPRFQKFHPHFTSINGTVKLSDAQLVIARENGFPSWAKFKKYLLFQNAVNALDDGDIQQLEALITKNPWLIRYQCEKGQWYETGYFAGANLLNHVAGNPIRCPLPSNIVEITSLLLRLGAVDTPAGRTVGLLLTSYQASEAGVALPLIDLISTALPNNIDLDDPETLTSSLLNQASKTAEALIRRGTKMDIRHSVGSGRQELVTAILDPQNQTTLDPQVILLPQDQSLRAKLLSEAFLWACRLGQASMVPLFLDYGVDLSAQGNSGQTGLHWAVVTGQIETVNLLLNWQAPLEEINIHGGTVLGQAVWTAVHEPGPHALEIISLLLAAGADLESIDYPTSIDSIDDCIRRHLKKIE